MSTAIDDAWSPEPELRLPAPRRFQPSEYPDLNAPNVGTFTLAGATGLVLGVVLLALGFAGGIKVGLLVLGVVLVIAGVAALTLPKRKAQATRERAERLVREGQPVMARIVTSVNLTGNSEFGRTVAYMITMPGGELVRREANADERALPRRIPANVTALLDLGTSDVELYCALPFRALAPPEAAAAPVDPFAGIPMAATAGGPAGALGTSGVTVPGIPTVPMAAPVASPAAPPQPVPPQPAQQQSPGYQGLPWE